MQVSLHIFLWLLFPSLTKHIDECSHWLIVTPIACLTSVLSTLISVNIDQPQNISWCALTTAPFNPSNVGSRDSRHFTGQIPGGTFNQSLILYWLDEWRCCNQKKITLSPRINVERVPLYSFYCHFLYWLFLHELHVPASRHKNTGWLTWKGRTESWMRGHALFTIYINMWTVSSDVSIQRRHLQSLLVHLWAYWPTQPMMWMMCEWCVEGGHTNRVYVPYSFRTVVCVLLRPKRTR